MAYKKNTCEYLYDLSNTRYCQFWRVYWLYPFGFCFRGFLVWSLSLFNPFGGQSLFSFILFGLMLIGSNLFGIYIVWCLFFSNKEWDKKAFAYLSLEVTQTRTFFHSLVYKSAHAITISVQTHLNSLYLFTYTGTRTHFLFSFYCFYLNNYYRSTEQEIKYKTQTDYDDNHVQLITTCNSE